MTLRLQTHEPGSDATPFIQAGHAVFAEDPAWVAPLDFEFRDRLNPAKNPFFDQAEACYWTAWRGERLVGRCSAQIDELHRRHSGDNEGFFGFFDTVDDKEVASALLERAAAWLRQRRVERMVGPFSLCFKEEFGILVDGFQHPPMPVMAHSRAYQGDLAEACGLARRKDLFAWRYEVGELPARVERAWEAVQAMPEVVLRSVDRRRLQAELPPLMDIFNDAWRDNWAFTPATPRDVDKMVEDLRWVLDTHLTIVAEIEGEAVGMCIAVPNVNEVIRDFKGKVALVEAFKALWRLKIAKPRSARLMLLGIKRRLRGVKKYAALSLAMYAEIAKAGRRRGLKWGELSLTLEDNHPINAGIRTMGGTIYKTYRLYDRPL